jgi:hypothetical protein
MLIIDDRLVVGDDNSVLLKPSDVQGGFSQHDFTPPCLRTPEAFYDVAVKAQYGFKDGTIRLEEPFHL